MWAPQHCPLTSERDVLFDYLQEDGLAPCKTLWDLHLNL